MSDFVKKVDSNQRSNGIKPWLEHLRGSMEYLKVFETNYGLTNKIDYILTKTDAINNRIKYESNYDKLEEELWFTWNEILDTVNRNDYMDGFSNMQFRITLKQIIEIFTCNNDVLFDLKGNDPQNVDLNVAYINGVIRTAKTTFKEKEPIDFLNKLFEYVNSKENMKKPGYYDDILKFFEGEEIRGFLNSKNTDSFYLTFLNKVEDLVKERISKIQTAELNPEVDPRE